MKRSIKDLWGIWIKRQYFKLLINYNFKYLVVVDFDNLNGLKLVISNKDKFCPHFNRTTFSNTWNEIDHVRKTAYSVFIFIYFFYQYCYNLEALHDKSCTRVTLKGLLLQSMRLGVFALVDWVHSEECFTLQSQVAVKLFKTYYLWALKLIWCFPIAI